MRRSLQGVGRKRAEAILQYRSERGPGFLFAQVADLKECGFGKKTLENFCKRNIFVGADSGMTTDGAGIAVVNP